MRCQEIMRRPVQVLAESESIAVAARMMQEVDIGFLPICDAHGTVVGVLTDRDIVTRVCAVDASASETPIKKVMTRALIACQPDDPVSKAAALMRQHRVTRIVIVDRVRMPLGILSLSDIAQYERPAKVGRTLQTVSERKYGPARP